MIISQYEMELEEDELAEWSNQGGVVPILDLEQIAYLLKHPPKFCEDKNKCVSYHLNKDRCRCVRTIFAHESHYEIYKQLLEEKVNSELINSITETD
jgi:hypothetical protein